MLVIEVTEHAIKRYGERVRPGLGASQLEGEVLRVIHDVGEVAWYPLDWCGEGDQRIVGWVNIGPDITFPLQFHWSKRGVLVAVTCLTRSAFGERLRAAKNERARRRRQRRAARRRDNYVPSARAA